MTARRTVLFVAAAIVLAGALGYGLYAHRAPGTQPPLADMDLAAFKAEFNRASHQTRVIVLLSPT